MSDHVLEDLKAARTLVAERWGKGTMFNEITGCYCLAGALRQASLGTPMIRLGQDNLMRYFEAAIAVGQQVRSKPSEHFSDFEGVLIWFNDTGTTTHEDVLRVLDAAIAVATPRPER